MKKVHQAKHIFDTYAQAYQEKYMDTSLYHHSFDVFCDAIEKQRASILEVGCGPGNITRYLLDKRPNFNVTACDVSNKMLALGKLNNPSATFKELDCREITSLQTKFDGIIAGFCLPYISKEEAIQFIVDAAQSLYANGVLYLSTMEGDYTTSGYVGSSSDGNEKLYTYYHEAAYLLKALRENGFKIVFEDRIINRPSNGKTTTDLFIIGKKD